MTREIKFRAWDKSSSKFLESRVGPRVFSTGDHFYDVAPWSAVLGSGSVFIMQFTGLHDKNGKEIYEGDICQYFTGEPLIVEWVQEDCSFKPKKTNGYKGHLRFDCDIEVVGNIYENGDLLSPPQTPEVGAKGEGK